MSVKVLKNYYLWLIKALVLVIPFLSLWISRSMFFPYITGRNFGFRVLVEIAFALWLGLIFLDRNYRPRPSWILWAIVAFTVIIGIADLAGVDSYNSFWSRLERMEGFLLVLHLTAYFLMLSTVLRNRKDWFILFNIFVIVATLVGGYGLLQKLGLEESIQGGVRIDGTIGNPAYLAAYLLLILTLALILFFNSQKKWLKYLYAAFIVFSLLIIYFTATRGVIIALLLSAPIFLLFYSIFFWKEEHRVAKWSLAFLILILLLPVIFLSVKDQQWVKSNPVLSRFSSISLQEKTTRSRLILWNLAWQAIKERPVLGWGQENFIQVFSKYYNPRLYDQEPWFDRSHNIVFDWLVNGGILGLASYLGLFAALFVGVSRLLKGKVISKKEGLVLILAPIAYFLQNLFVFDNFNTYILFFALLAYIHSLQAHSQNTVALPKEKSQKPALLITVAALFAALVCVYFVNIKPIAQARGIINSLMAISSQIDPAGKALAEFKETLSYDTFANAETLEQLAGVTNSLLAQPNIPIQSKIPFLQYTIEKLEKYLGEFPNNVRIRLMLASLYNNGKSLSPEFVSKARQHIMIALAQSPKKQQIIFLLVDSFLATGEVNKALEWMDRAVVLEPSYLDAQVNRAIVSIFAKRNDNVLNTIKLLKDWQENSTISLIDYMESLAKITDMFAQSGEKQNAQAVFGEILRIEPEIKSDQEKAIFQNIVSALKKEIY